MAQHLFGRGLARAQGGGLRKIQQHRGKHITLVFERDAADQVRRIFALGEPARRLIGRAALRQDVDGGAVDAAIADRIRVNRDEQIGLLRTRARIRSRSGTK